MPCAISVRRFRPEAVSSKVSCSVFPGVWFRKEFSGALLIIHVSGRTACSMPHSVFTAPIAQPFFCVLFQDSKHHI